MADSLLALGEFHGWAFGPDGPALHVERLPHRPRPALTVHDGTEVRALAYFRSEADAVLFTVFIDSLLGMDPDAVAAAVKEARDADS